MAKHTWHGSTIMVRGTKGVRMVAPGMTPKPSSGEFGLNTGHI